MARIREVIQALQIFDSYMADGPLALTTEVGALSVCCDGSVSEGDTRILDRLGWKYDDVIEEWLLDV